SPCSSPSTRSGGAPAATGRRPMSTKHDRRRSRPVGDRAMQRATLMALIVGLVLDGLLILFAAVRHDSPAVLGAVVGTVLTLVIVVPSVTIAFTGKRMTPVTMAAAVLGSWAGKMMVVIIVLVLLKDVDAVSKRWSDRHCWSERSRRSRSRRCC